MIRVGIVGVAGVGAKHFQALRTIDSVEVTALVDRDERSFDLHGDLYGHSIPRFASLDACMDDLDALYICTPPSSHEELTTFALRHRKHVLCEKPIARTFAEGRRMQKAARESGCLLATGFNMRLRQSYRYFKEVLDSHVIGDPLSYWCVRLGNLGVGSDNWRVHRREAVGMTTESLAHEFDTIRWLFGEIESISARVRCSREDLPGIDDQASVSLDTSSHVIATITASWSSSISTGSRGIIGTKGTVEMRGDDIWSVSSVRWKDLATGGVQERTFSETLGWEAYTGLSEAFIDAIRGGQTCVPDASDGLEALRISLAALRSSRGGGRLVRL